jgi:short-subunit dehydrogenase
VPRETALITGASSGLGWELARLFAADGSDLILTARRVDRLEALAAELQTGHGVHVRVIGLDLSRPGAARELFQQTTADGTQVDVLVNNAGFGKLVRFQDLPVETYTAMLELNVTALTELTRLFLPAMLARRRGHILNVASTASFQPGPNAAVYYASKAYVRSFSEALAEELRGSGVTVTALCPGPTKTGFGEESAMEGTLLFRYAMEAAPVALAGYRAMRRGRTTVITGLGNRVLALNSKLLPGWIVRKVVKWLQPVPAEEAGAPAPAASASDSSTAER